MENSAESMNKDVVVLHLTNLFCVLRNYLNLDICKVVCTNITTRVLTNEGEYYTKNVDFVSGEMNTIFQDKDFKCDKNLTKSFLENVVIPDENSVIPNENSVIPDQNSVIPDQNSVIPDQNSVTSDQNSVTSDQNSVTSDPNQTEWLDKQNKICNLKNEITCRIPFNDCTYSDKDEKGNEKDEKDKACIANYQDYTFEKLEKIRQSIDEQKAKEAQKRKAQEEKNSKDSEVLDFKQYLNVATNGEEWVDRMEDYCKVKLDDNSCGDKNNGCTKQKDICIPDIKDFKNKDTLKYKGKFLKVSDEVILKKQNQRLANSNQKTSDLEKWVEKQNKICEDKTSTSCKMPMNDCTWDETITTDKKCKADKNDYSDKKLQKLIDEELQKNQKLTDEELQKKVKVHFNSINDVTDWQNALTDYCKKKTPASCRESKNGCTKSFGSDTCTPDKSDFKIRDQLTYRGDLSGILPAVVTDTTKVDTVVAQ
jgi:hypothetical protein